MTPSHASGGFTAPVRDGPPMPGPVFLRGDRLTLRPVEPEDHDFLYRHWCSRPIRRWVNVESPLAREEFEEWFADDAAAHFLPCLDGDPVGCVFLMGIDDVADRGEVGYWILPERQGEGFGREALDLALRWAFEDRNLHRVMARVFEGNEPSANLLESAGFTHEGRFRDHEFVGGERADVDLFGVLRAEYERDEPRT